MLVMLAIEPRIYREAIGKTIQNLRSHVEVVILGPEEVEDRVVTLDPDLVICDGSITSNPAWRTAWVEYSPYEEPSATVSLAGQHTKLEKVELEDLLMLVDKAEELARSRTELRNH